MQMETLLDEEKVSDSQRQRILLAGQLLRRPRMVMLDEATSALDEATSALDEAVQARLFANLRGLRLPCVVVAHRPSTLWYADRIYRLHEGRIVQSGTPAEVLGEALTRRAAGRGVARRRGGRAAPDTVSPRRTGALPGSDQSGRVGDAAAPQVSVAHAA